MLRDGKFRRSSFVFREYGCAAQRYPVSVEVIESEMILQRQFNLPKYMVYLTDKHAMVHGAIRLENGQEYPLSGFPKQLIVAKEASRSRALEDGSGGAESISSQKSLWEVPNLPEMPSPKAQPDNSSGSLSEDSASHGWARSFPE
jgi:hypothetical protein